MQPQASALRQFKYQPVINSSLTHGILRNQGHGQPLNIGIPPMIPKLESSKEKHSPIHLKRTRKIKNTPRTPRTGDSPAKPLVPPVPQSNSIRDRSLRRPSSFESIPAQRNVPLPSSFSVSDVHDRIQRERKAHTMPPLAHITGPSQSPKAKLFASIVAPVDAQAIKASTSTQEISRAMSISSRRSEADLTDDDATVIVKVRYDPEAGAPPSEETIRQAVNNQLKQRSDLTKKREPIVVNFLGQNLQQNFPLRPQQPVFNRPLLPFQQRPSLRIPVVAQQQQQPIHQQARFPLPRSAPLPSSFPLMPPLHRAPFRLPLNAHIHPNQSAMPFIRQQTFHPRVLLRPFQQTLNSAQSTRPAMSPLKPITSPTTGIDNNFSANTIMATGQASPSINVQQNAAKQLQLGSFANNMYRPSPVTEVPELSKESILNMLNQIPDLQGRHFNIEYVEPNAPEGYPIPSSAAAGANIYPEPVVIDQLPNNVIQHVKQSNNPAITAALEATIRREQSGPSSVLASSLKAPSPTIVHHAAQPHGQVQQSRPSSSNDSESSTEVSSSGTSSSSSSSSSASSSSTEESESEEVKSVPSARPLNDQPFVGPASLTSHSQKHCR